MMGNQGLHKELKDKYTLKKLKKIWHTNEPQIYIEYFNLSSKEFNV